MYEFDYMYVECMYNCKYKCMYVCTHVLCIIIYMSMCVSTMYIKVFYVCASM